MKKLMNIQLNNWWNVWEKSSYIFVVSKNNK